MSTVHVLGNPAARGGTGDVERVVGAVVAAKHQAVLLEAPSAEDAARVASDAVAAGADRIIAVGGDGLVRIAVGATAETGCTLGIVPQGTGNDFARALDLLDGRLDDHVRRALAAPVAVDAMRTEHGWVASVATVGFSGDVTDRANGLRWPRGQQRYTVATVLQLPRLRRLGLTVTIDGETHDAATTMLSVGNTAYFGGGMRICPEARPDDGLLQTVVIGDVSRSTFLRVFPRVFGGRHVDHPDVATYRSASVRIAAADGADVMMWADGDPLGPLPLTCTAVPGALQVAGATPATAP